jgi:hypothetical protein
MKFPEQYRVKVSTSLPATKEGDHFGLFIIPSIKARGRTLNIIACDGLDTGWDHVSVSLAGNIKGNTPSWEEMCLVKDLFWDDSDCVVQFHPPKKDNVNIGEVLHLWKWNQPFPMPPKECV